MKIAVIGAGLMGSGIAQTCAQAGYEVKNIDVFKPAIEKAKENIEKIFVKKIAKGKITEAEKAEVLERLTYSSNMEDVKGADLIIEAVPEKIDLKKSVFEQLDKLADPETLIVSNTSGLSISEIAAATNRPDKVMGVHFFYPAPVMKLVELIRGIATADETYHKVKEFAIAIKKTVVDAPEYPGFIVNRVLVPMQNEAAFMVMEGCKPEDVDNAMKLGCNFPMGPLELTDFVGVDVMLATMTGLYNGFHDSKYRPCPLLETMVKAGHLGRKSGQGFYKYE
ncbi:3-hydroxybutyryl-CoA dehydrogenase [Eubacterium sp. am_0171]|uniref:3-hydroxyacyl-CoA dehydrogenase family protein n=1 Tax=unclassified Eubacterium (in: firmicutes) TaxID=2624479 RepID=UPI001021ADB1|nr:MULTISPECIES: 3-hydroxyacyl-CoA dehydrogenase NAD-binding domain-containing protein [unclassified Eubacterium (in: firmicutes)]MSC82478.1 3-hydroxybutyryl-CoA dehydrogenase [Eubacterium sp. BIOML-A1]MSD05505.1 3-hydroxybutyryl-CoA dehydrogenase [Eubacterium sp. BIOML-A2]RYT24757.1 3-hydroxybutyryl-CoA dehydrogenase [Eubacterium sp. am_0171]